VLQAGVTSAWLGFTRNGPSSTSLNTFKLPNGTVVADIGAYGGSRTTYNGQVVGWCSAEPNDSGDAGEHCSELRAPCVGAVPTGFPSTGGGDCPCNDFRAVLCSYSQACPLPPSPLPPPPSPPPR
jgi:hypothetical protein